MKYSVEGIGDNGVRFNLFRGQVTDLYRCITGALNKFYKGTSVKFIPQSFVGLDNLTNDGNYPIKGNRTVRENGEDGGDINMELIIKRVEKKRKGVDYDVSDTYDKETLFIKKTIAMYFDTNRGNFLSEEMIGEIQRKERDEFVQRLRNLVEKGCGSFYIATNRPRLKRKKTGF